MKKFVVNTKSKITRFKIGKFFFNFLKGSNILKKEFSDAKCDSDSLLTITNKYLFQIVSNLPNPNAGFTNFATVRANKFAALTQFKIKKISSAGSASQEGHSEFKSVCRTRKLNYNLFYRK